MTLAAVLACRNQSSRLYAKPLQYLDVKNAVTILDFLIGQLRLQPTIDKIILAVSEEKENAIYAEVAKKHELPFVFGSDGDVLRRLIQGAEKAGADQIFRVTTESPYCHLGDLKEVYAEHCRERLDYSVLSGPPDGAYYELIRTDALKKSWEKGESKHRSELCTSYIFDHQDQFRIKKFEVAPEARGLDCRLTVDWPEDLIVLRKICDDLGLRANQPVSIPKIIAYLRAHPKVNAVNNWIDSGIGRIWY